MQTLQTIELILGVYWIEGKMVVDTAHMRLLHVHGLLNFLCLTIEQPSRQLTIILLWEISRLLASHGLLGGLQCRIGGLAGVGLPQNLSKPSVMSSGKMI